jgi:polyisoprenyl-teichoic acid--peptidoglycan teichoic acid transferase
MAYTGNYQSGSKNPLSKKRRWLKPLLVVIAIFIFIGGIFVWKTGFILSKISTKGSGGLLQSLTHVIPGTRSTLLGEEGGRINIALLGMRGDEDPAGGTLSDTIIVLSIEPKENRIAMVSVPRDLWVQIPGTNNYGKINSVHAYGEEDGKKQGLPQMEKVLENVLGLPIQYAVKIDFQGFKDLVNSLGGVTLHLENNFSEPVQFMGIMGRCDATTFVIPAGQDEVKTSTRKKDGSVQPRHYPLCFTKTPSECGGNFKLSAGDITLNGDQALCLARARDTSSDFERAKRQQIILQKIEEKATSLGTLSDFTKVNGMLDALGNNVKTDMQAWEMKRLYDIYKGMQNPAITQRVLENSDEGLLYTPPETPEKGYTLLPIGDNYDRIHDMFANIFTLPAQSDIDPKI